MTFGITIIARRDFATGGLVILNLPHYATILSARGPDPDSYLSHTHT